jgi:predicted phage-related endonuclease
MPNGRRVEHNFTSKVNLGDKPMITERRSFIGGSDARIIMGNDEAKLVRLWQEKRGEIKPEDLTQDLLVQLGTITEQLNRTWYERCTGQAIGEVQRRVRHPIHKWMGATLDGRVQQT